MEKLSKIVPEFFYDVIGRLVPGAVFVAVVATVVAKDPTAVQSHLAGADMTFAYGLLLIVLAYCAGLTLDLFGALLEEVWDRALPSDGSYQHIPPRSGFVWRRVREAQAHGNLVPLKLRAEILMFRSLWIAGSVLAFGFDKLAWWWFFPGTVATALFIWRLSIPFCDANWAGVHQPSVVTPPKVDDDD